ADINEPPFEHRVPGAVIYTRPGTWLRIVVRNDDDAPHSLHLHGLRHGIDSDGAWPFGTQAAGAARSDEICPGQTWTYTFEVTEYLIGAWPFHDHYRDIEKSVNRGLFGAVIVLPEKDFRALPRFRLPDVLLKMVRGELAAARPVVRAAPARVSHSHQPAAHIRRDPTAPTRGGHKEDESHAESEARDEALEQQLVLLAELAHAPQPMPKPTEPLYVPLFIHVMQGEQEEEEEEENGGGRGDVVDVRPIDLQPVDFVLRRDNVFVLRRADDLVGGLDDLVVRPDVLDAGRARLSRRSLCFNGRTFVGNTPTILATAGQRIRWYVFNLDLGQQGWHNFHPHGQRWRFANETIAVRSLGPAEAFVVETNAPPVLLLPPRIERYQAPRYRPRDARLFKLRGDFPFHCHSADDMQQGLVGLVRSTQEVWLTPQDAALIRSRTGLPLDAGDNDCPAVDFERCANAANGKWEEVPGVAGVTFMHAVLLANTRRVLFWGYNRPDQTRVWDQATGAYDQPFNQPISISPDTDLWSGSHAYLNDAAGTILIHGGYSLGLTPPFTVDTERRTFLFDPPSLTWVDAADTTLNRFYPSTVTLADGRVMTLFGQNTVSGVTSSAMEIFTPGGAGAWSAPEPLPFNFFYYPWTFVLPDGEIFIAGPQKPARRFDPTVLPVVDDPARQFDQVFSQRGVNMNGTAALLPLRPPNYEPRVLIAGGNGPDTGQSAELIDLSVPAPAWQALPNMNIARDNMNCVLLPDGKLIVLGGTLGGPDGGPVETFDPDNPAAGFVAGPSMAHERGYHSAALLLADGSVLVGGDPGGDFTPHERYLPPYFFAARPTITGAPANIAYGAGFTVNTPEAAEIAEVVLMRPGAVTHAFNMSQRHVGCAIVSAAGNSVQATAPPDGNVAPPGYYLLFVVNGDRVPSEGVWIRLS
ncbi:MAG TPA: galactose oxidase-like domain-containing protein, partial [Pyrinomonadaceae bacterium]